MDEKTYQHEYYMKVTKLKRQAQQEAKPAIECTCVKCGIVFPAKTKNTKYCPECKKLAARERMRNFRASGKQDTEKYIEMKKRSIEKRKVRYNNDEETRKKQSERMRLWHQRNLENMSEEELAAFREKKRQIAREHYYRKKKQQGN